MRPSPEKLRARSAYDQAQSEDLRSRLRVILQESGLKQGHLARTVDIRPVTLSAFMKKRTRSMRPEAMDRLSQAVTFLETQSNIRDFRTPGLAATGSALSRLAENLKLSKASQVAAGPQSSRGEPGGDRTVFQDMREEMLEVLGANDEVFQTTLQRMSDMELFKRYCDYRVGFGKGSG